MTVPVDVVFKANTDRKLISEWDVDGEVAPDTSETNGPYVFPLPGELHGGASTGGMGIDDFDDENRCVKFVIITELCHSVARV